jgi:hypothetical protein
MFLKVARRTACGRAAVPLAILSLLLGSASARADFILNYSAASTFSGTAPAGSLTATFTDVAGGVKLVLSSSLAAGENLDPGPEGAFFFNFDPSQSTLLSSLNFQMIANTNFSQAATVSTGEDAFKADGGGYYDVLFSYKPSTKAFTGGESQTYMITSNSGTVTSADFYFLSTPSGGNGTWLSAVHVQNTPNGGNGSAFVAGTNGPSPSPTPVPVPPTLLLGGLGALIWLPFQLRQLRPTAR